MRIFTSMYIIIFEQWIKNMSAVLVLCKWKLNSQINAIKSNKREPKVYVF